jgi:hypothetical protein
VQLLAARRVGNPPLPINPGELVDDQLGSDVGRDLSERIVGSRRVGKWLPHGHRPVAELNVWRDDLNARPLRRECAQGKRCLQRGDATAGDHDRDRILVAHLIPTRLRRREQATGRVVALGAGRTSAVGVKLETARTGVRGIGTSEG